MGWMCRYLVSCWTWCSLLSIVNAEEQLELGSPKDCENADFIPGHNLGGEGFDVVKMERKGSYVIDLEKWDIGNGSCKMSRNAYMNNAKQKMPVAVVFWRTLPKCSMKVSSQIYDSSEALVNDSTSSISNNWKVGLMWCLRLQFRYKIVSSPPLHQEFLQAMQSLPREYDSDSYQSIIDMFGTHFTTGVVLGGKMKAVTAINTCKSAMSGHSGQRLFGRGSIRHIQECYCEGRVQTLSSPKEENEYN
ncbi:hypothetical protein SRHO_G00311160 [Serrasalmus rhombeus]